MGQDKIVNKFKKIAIVIKAAVITKTLVKTDNNYSKTYE